VPLLLRITSAFCLAIALVSTAAGKDLEDEKWIEASTDNFTIRSILGKRKTLDLLRQLEVLRTAVPLLTNSDRVEPPVPTKIYAVKRASHFDEFGIDRDFVGLFQPRLRNNTILVRDVPNMDEASIILHEYVHFLMRTHSGVAYPRWYHEGYAEYLGSVQISRNDFRIGAVPEARVYGILNFSWLSAEQLMNPDEYDSLSRNQTARFYSQSWALVHYLLNRQDRNSSFAEEMRSYLQLVAGGNTEVAAFEEAFGIARDELVSTLKSYLRYKCCNVFEYEIEQLQLDFSPTVRALSKAEVALGLGQAALALGEYDSAKRWYEIAVTAEDTRAAAEAGLGDLLKFDDRHEAALVHFKRAAELGPDDAYVQLDVGEFWLDQAAAANLPAERKDFARRARRSFLKAWKIDSSIPEIYVMNGRAYLLEGASLDKAVEMFEEAQFLFPANLQIRMDLADAYARSGRNEEAIRAAQVILSWGHGNDRPAEFARTLIDQLSTDDTTSASNR